MKKLLEELVEKYGSKHEITMMADGSLKICPAEYEEEDEQTEEEKPSMRSKKLKE